MQAARGRTPVSAKVKRITACFVSTDKQADRGVSLDA
jgi:hypothetical protein